MRNRLAWLVLFLLALSAISSPGWAQSDTSAWITQVQTDAFPQIRVYLDAHSASSGFVYGLEGGNLRLVEDGQLLEVAEFEALRPGVQAVIVINPGESLEIRNSQGVSRFDLVRQALIGWLAKRQGSTVDDLSLVIDGGPERSHTGNPQELIAALGQYEVAASGDVPGLDPLTPAMDIAADATPREGMERAVLFVTSPLNGDVSDGVETLIPIATLPRRLAEIALQEQQTQTQRYLDTVQTLMVALDNEGCITMINRAGCLQLGYEESELIGHNWFATCLPPAAMNDVYPVFRKIIAGELEQVRYFENAIRCKDGRERLYAWHNAIPG